MAIAHDIIKQLGETLRTTPAKDDLELAIKYIATEPLAVVDLIARIRSTEEQFHDAANKSYWHCNGFARIVLFSNSSYALRLHIWPAGAGQTAAVNPHGHRWEFASWIAAGPGIRETYFYETDNPEELAYDRYDYNGQGDLRHHNEQVRLRKQALEKYETGRIYTCASEVVHTVEPTGNELVASIVLQGPPVARSAPVYVRPDSTPEGAERPMSADELRTLLIKAEVGIGQRA